MGNKLVRRRLAVDEKYTKPQGLYQHKDVDHKKLRKLILDSKLAPCYPGDDDSGSDLEECPICFLYYPSLNRSRCCTKGICTECFLQMKTPGSTRPTRCPFCKTADYAVEYRGVKTKEEKGMEQIEEQRVIEAKIRMQQQEIQDEEGRKQKRRDTSSSSRTISLGEFGYDTVAGEEIVSSQESCPSMRQSSRPRQDRDDEFDLDFEDIMVMEAIWLSIQENGRHRYPAYGDSVPSEPYMTDMPPLVESSLPPSEGLARAIAVLAEHQQIGGESSANYNGDLTTFNILGEQETERGRLAMTRRGGEWAVVDHGSEVAEVGTSSEDGGRIFPAQHENEGSFQAVGVPDNFEEQMMLAMAVSLADARAMATAPGVAWQ